MNVRLILSLLACLSFTLGSCRLAPRESRRVDLPVHPEVSLESAKALCFELAQRPLGSVLQREVPAFLPGYHEDLFVGWGENPAVGGSGIYIDCGVTQSDRIPEAAAVADAFREIVAEAVATRFPARP